jgi:hypothetical protein
MKFKLAQVLKAILFVMIFGTIIYVIKYYNKISFREETDQVNFKGRLSTKYIDKIDHNIPKLEIHNNAKTIVYDLANEKSGLFEYINIGDSIEKFSNSIKVHVFSSSKDTIFILSF